MPRRSSFHNDPPEAQQRASVRQTAARAEFGRRLQRQIISKGLNQKDLAEAAQKLAPEGMRVGADQISHYINGRYMPSPPMLKLLAQVLEIDPVELMPVGMIPEAGEKLPPVAVQDMDDGTAWLKVNQAVPWPIAVKVLDLLRGDDEK